MFHSSDLFLDASVPRPEKFFIVLVARPIAFASSLPRDF